MGAEGGTKGWKLSGISEQEYFELLLRYEAECLKDPYIIAVTPFTGGATTDWSNYDTDPIAGRLAATAGTLPTPPEVTPVAPLPWRGKILTVWNLPSDPQTLVAACRGAAVDGVEIKVADGDSSWLGRRNVTKAYCDALRAAGLRVLSWSYNYCDLVTGQAQRGDGVPEKECDAAVAAATAIGAEGHTFDLEIECEGHADLVAIMLDRASRSLPTPIAAHVWADLAGHQGYPAGVIARYVDCVRPMAYRPVWTADQAYRAWEGYGVPICPVWGITEGTTEQILLDMEVADRRGAQGEAYWEYAALRPGSPIALLLAGRRLGDTTAVDWETPVFGPIYRGASAVGGMPDATAEDNADAQEAIKAMDRMKLRHPPG